MGQISTVVVVMNLLIALMNSTIANIQEDKIKEWRFSRTQIWRKYFDSHKMSYLPVPFNLLEMIMNLIMMIIKTCQGERRICQSEIASAENGRHSDDKEERREYVDLVRKLCCRYIK